MRFSLLLVVLFCNTLFGQENRLKISPLTKNFFVFTTWQSIGGTPFPSNGLYVVTNDGVIMIDTPWDTTQFQPLLDSIEFRHHKKVVVVIATHSHKDRTGGLAYYNSLGIPTYTTVMTDEISRAKGEHRASNLILKDTTFNVGGMRFETFYGGKGHTADNIVIWFDHERVLYGGCLVKSTEAKDLGNISEGDLNAYPNTIKKVKDRFKKIKYVIPGHQSWENKMSLDHTLHLLQKNLYSLKQKNS
jgi:metallo-beta-lactamase class B